MTRTIELPIWLFILILLFAAATFASHFLLPSVRWFFRRRMERVVARLNTRLQRPIEPFKLARRYDMIQRLIYDPQVTRAVAEHARANGIPESVAFQAARRYAREIVPGFSASAYFGIAIRMARWLSQTLYYVRLSQVDEATKAHLASDATVIFVMNHRSNMDYVLVTWLAANSSALSYAVGEWARVWPLSGLIRAMGAYFIRRRSRDDLYRRVLARYVTLATEGRVTQAMFPEGGLSLDGRLGPPRLGLLKYIIEGHDPDSGDVVFIPVALNYDRVFEDYVLVSANKRGDRRFPARIRAVVRFVLWQLWLKIARRYHRHGQAAVSFGAPVSLSAFERDQPAATTEDLANLLMRRIAGEVPILAVPLVAHLLVTADGPQSRAELERRAQALLADLPDALRYLPGRAAALAVADGLGNLRRRHMLTGSDEAISIAEPSRDLVTYYANSIAHFFADAE